MENNTSQKPSGETNVWTKNSLLIKSGCQNECPREYNKCNKLNESKQLKYWNERNKWNKKKKVYGKNKDWKDRIIKIREKIEGKEEKREVRKEESAKCENCCACYFSNYKYVFS
jgi:hypothetical protein